MNQSNGSSAVVTAEEIELTEPVLRLIVEVLSASPNVQLLGQRIAGLLEGKGLAGDTPARLVITSAKLILNPPAE